MPYIKEDQRQKFDAYIKNMPSALGPGELNYIFYKLALKYIENNESYQAYNDIIGAFSCCGMELYRRQIVILEDKKIKENGDII